MNEPRMVPEMTYQGRAGSIFAATQHNEGSHKPAAVSLDMKETT